MSTHAVSEEIEDIHNLLPNVEGDEASPHNGIHFSTEERRFPGWPTDDLPPSSPPAYSSDSEEEKENNQPQCLADLQNARDISEQALLQTKYFDESCNLVKILSDTVEQLEVHLQNSNRSWWTHFQNYDRKKAMLDREVKHLRTVWNGYQDTIAQLSQAEEDMAAQKLKSNKRENEFLRQIHALEVTNRRLRIALSDTKDSLQRVEYDGQQQLEQLTTRLDRLALDNDDLKYALSDTETKLGTPEAKRLCNTVFSPPSAPCTFPVSEMYASPTNPEDCGFPISHMYPLSVDPEDVPKLSKAARYRAKNRELLREKAQQCRRRLAFKANRSEHKNKGPEKHKSNLKKGRRAWRSGTGGSM
ncbi:hypothetical protein V5O48_015881 [Marasmius crinis-equi]|uniref:BZIP domain-containing protein n=1 Tax=Marasmius crinis-equi TaxID=585013 RepID=A0ABR3ETC2_9AGAR